jgi:hypothetical protein
MIELTKRERKIAEISVKRYHGLFYKKSHLLGWVGCLLFLMGLLKIFSVPQWCRDLFLYIGFTVLTLSILVQIMGLVGKLYEEVQRLESRRKVKG